MRIHHLALRTADVARLTDFYAGVLGLPEVRRDGERSVWLDAGGTLVMLERREASEPAVAAGTNELVAFAIAPEDCARFAERLAAAGAAIDARTDFTLYTRDPDGRRVGLSSYPAPLRVT